MISIYKRFIPIYKINYYNTIFSPEDLTMSMKNAKTHKPTRQDSVQDAIVEEADSIEDTEEERIIPTFHAADQTRLLASPNAKEPFDQQRWFAEQTDTEKNRPKLKIGTIANYKIFRPAFIIYKEEDNGIKSMVESISKTVCQNLLIHLQMDSSTFSSLSDEKCMKKLDKHFKLEDSSNYRATLVKIYMKPLLNNDKINCDEIQIYVESFLDALYSNPHFHKDKGLRGITAKILNDIFMDGFTPPVFKSLVKNLEVQKYRLQ